jgi:DNA-directed RNA polymerase subunit RPC12/RpoP
MIVRNCSDCPYFEVGVAEQNTGEHVIKLDIKTQNMATVYQCVKCKVLFKDLQGVSLHTCLSLIKPKDLQAPLSPLTVQIRHQAQIKVKNELIPAQQVRLNLLSRRSSQ